MEIHNILLIEDSREDALLFQRQVDKAKMPWKIIKISSLNEISLRLCEEKISLVVTDFHLNQFTAEDVIKFIRSKNDQVPIIVISGAVGEEAAAEVMRKGANDFVRKDNSARLIPAILREIAEYKVRVERQKTKEALINAEAFTEKLIESSDDCIKVLDLTGKILNFSKAGLEALEIPSIDKVIGTLYPDLWSNEEGATASRNAIKLAAEGKKARFTGYGPSASGKPLWWSIQMSPVFNAEGKVEKILAISRDVTSEKLRQEEAINHANELSLALQQAESANQMKSAFLANMSHEIRTPIGVMMGFSELATDQDISIDQRREFAKIIQRNGDTVLRLLNEILDLSKIESGNLTLEKSEFLVKTIIDDLKAVWLPAAAEKDDFNLVFEISNEISNIVRTDFIRLKQILTNLLSNAFKFTESGLISVKVKETILDNESFIEFLVEDTGIGIRAEDANRLFKPFSQLDSGLNRKYSGTGLGLSLSKKLANALGGDLILKNSVFGKGSCFSVFVKNDRTQLPANLENVDKTQKSKLYDFSHLKILLAEDNIDNQVLIQKMLTNVGANVLVVEDGEKAIQTILKNEFDIVIMDLQMPILDGISAMERLQTEKYQKPVIALTANAMNESRNLCLASGFSDFLAKPILALDLYNSIKKLADLEAYK